MNNKNKKVIIVGSGGFISSALEKILIIKKKNFLSLRKAKVNLLSKKKSIYLKKILKNGDTIIFIAADAPVRNLEQYIKNIIMLKNFVNNVDPKKIKKIVYLSSDAVYSDTKKKINEKNLTSPTSLHGNMHLQREIILKNIYNKKMCIIRPTLVYGSLDPHNGYGPNSFIRKYLLKKNIILFGKGEERRDHIWVDDLAMIIYKCLFGNFFGIINVATSQTISFYEIAKLIKKIEKSKSKILFKKRIGPIHHLGLRQFDISLLKKKFKGFEPKKIKDILPKIYRSYKIKKNDN